MEGRCIFVFFMIFNSIFGLVGLGLLGLGIAAIIIKPTTSTAGTITVTQAAIALIVIGGYITLLLILGACSWKKTGVLIAYFILSIFLLLAEVAMIIVIKVADNAVDGSSSEKEAFHEGAMIALIAFGVALGISFMSFLCSTIYFCTMRRASGPQLYSEVKNMEYMNMPQYQNV